MKAIKAHVKDGQVVLAEPIGDKGEYEAVVVLLDGDPWADLMTDPRPRPALAGTREAALAEHAQGQTTPLDPDDMP